MYVVFYMEIFQVKDVEMYLIKVELRLRLR